MPARLLLCVLLAALSVGAGLLSLGALFAALTPRRQLVEVEGRVLEVRTDVDSNPGYAAMAGSNARVFEVVYAYAWSGREFTSNTASPLCTRCASADFELALGLKPTALQRGSSVRVLVDTRQPGRAYLMLPSRQALLMQGLFAGVFLLLGPAFIAFFCVQWERRPGA